MSSTTSIEDSTIAPTPDSDSVCDLAPAEDPEAGAVDESIVDPRGDLWLHTQGTDSQGCSTQVRFRVCSRTLARASPAFDDMLFGNFAEAATNQSSDSDSDWTIKLPEDPSSAMKLLFEIMHSRHQHQTALSSAHETLIPRLYDLLVVADKYDCIDLFRPWAASWVHRLNAKDKSERDLLHLSWVFYQLGHATGYKAVMTRLIMDFPVSRCDDGAKAFAALLPHVLPHDLLEKVESIRRRFAGNLLRPVNLNVEQLVKGDVVIFGTFCKVKSPDSETSDCEALMLGKAIRGLQKGNLWPLPVPDTIPLSLRALDALISQLTIDCRASLQGPHALCSAISLPARSHTFYLWSFDIPKYSTDFQYDTVGKEIDHFTTRSQITGIQLFAPDKLAAARNILFFK
ncbi:BTB/POZ domain-containing protein [Microdochium nivale]|nr:BTB/POZ domain-containing protein [Microdochium nivale]